MIELTKIPVVILVIILVLVVILCAIPTEIPIVVPVEINCKNLRAERQKANNDLMFQCLRSGDIKLVKHHCNVKALNRLLEDLLEVDFNEEELMNKCKDDVPFAKVVARQISKLASRQGTKDEAFILQKCNETTSKVGVYIENLSTTAFRPTKDGRILTNKQYKKSGLKKNDCLKSFDAKLSGSVNGVAVNGWIFAKIAFGKGGHQDNVFSEAYEFGEWAKKHGDNEELYILLIDTDLTREFELLKAAFNHSTVLVCNHVELQQIFINLKSLLRN